MNNVRMSEENLKAWGARQKRKKERKCGNLL